ncbi:MAG: CotH kinase family protein, partial [Planctomycetota bacterium]
FVELTIDPPPRDGHSYRGVYQLVERIKRGRHRVAIPKNKEGTEAVAILAVDKISPGDVLVRTPRGQRFNIRYPKASKITEEQRLAIEASVTRAEKHVFGKKHPLSEAIDVQSFVDYLLLQGFANNVDAFWGSAFLSVDADGRIAAGPIWDLDLGFGGTDRPETGTEGWRLPKGAGTVWWHALTRHPEFRQRLVERWRHLRNGPFADSALSAYLADNARSIAPAMVRTTIEWNSTRSVADHRRLFLERVDDLTRWVCKRAAWMDDHIEEFPGWPDGTIPAK